MSGRWKATTVAVKIIEHQAAEADSSGGRRVSAGRESLLATSVSHPNVVTTYHISTMTMAERSALANKWLQEAGGAPADTSAAAAAGDASFADADSTASSDADEGRAQAQLSETWVVMEWCERGCLERAIKQGSVAVASGRSSDLVSGLAVAFVAA
jgi:hypothetical protein